MSVTENGKPVEAEEVFLEEAKDFGFRGVAMLNVESLAFLPEVRDMCSADRCNAYNKNWTCPPACGTIEECAAQAAGFSKGILVQTVGEVEDSFDFESMEQIAKDHKEHFAALAESLRGRYGNVLALGAGGCNICDTCTCPDAPCRFPDKALSSMEGYGLLVSDVCIKNNLPYYYGPNTMTYTGCILFN